MIRSQRPVIASLVCITVAVLLASTAGQSTVASTEQTLTDGGKEPLVSYLETTQMRLAGAADLAASDGTMNIPAGLGREVTIDSLTEFELFLPGEKKVRWLGANGEVVREEPLDIRFFRGENPETGEIVTVTISQHGIYTSFEDGGRIVSVQPIAEPADGFVLESIEWDELPAGTSRIAGDLGRELASLPIGVPSTSGMATYSIWLAPYAEPSYTTYASDYASRISSAFGWGQTMWQTETDILLRMYAVSVTPWNFYSITNGCAGYYDSGLQNFRDAWVASNLWTGPNAYALFHAIDQQKGVGGCAAGPNLQNSNQGSAGNTKWASLAVTGYDGFSTDSYDPDRTHHLGISANHELSHLGGAGHDTDGNICGWYNLMRSGDWYSCIDDWRQGSTQTTIENYSWPRIHRE